MDRLKFAVIGTGGLGGHRIRQIQGRPDAVVVAGSDPSEDALKRAKEQAPDIATYPDWREMLEKHPDLDALVVASPHTTHTDQVKAGLERGLHVLVEKPMTTTAEDARALIALSESKGKVLAIGYQRHGEARYRECRRLLQEEKAIGDLKLITVLIAQDCYRLFGKNPDGSYASWRADPALSGGGHLMDTGSHIVDMLLWLTGLEPKRVASFANNHGGDVDIFTANAVEFTNGCVGTLATTAMAADGWREEFTFYGTEGMLTVRDDGIRYQKQGGDLIWPRQFRDRGKDPMDNFLDAIAGSAEVQAPPICGLRVVQLTETAFKSAASGEVAKAG